MAEGRLDLPEGYDPDAQPADLREASGGFANGLRRLRRIVMQQAELEAKRKELITRLLPKMHSPVMLRDPITGESIVASATQARPITVDVGELAEALTRHWLAEGLEADDAKVRAHNTVTGVLKPPAVDTRDGGLFHQAAERGEIPLSVVAEVAREKPSSAYISFPKPRK